MILNLRKTISILGVSALLGVPVAMSSANVKASANTTSSYANTINWNNKYGEQENSIDEQPAIANPSGIQFTKGFPSAKYGSQFEFTVPGSDDVYAASWRSPLAHELLADQRRDGIKPVAQHRVSNGNVPRLHKAIVPQRQGKLVANKSNKEVEPVANAKNSNNVNHGKLTQTNESNLAQNAGMMAGIVAVASAVCAGVAKLRKRA